VFGYTTRPWKDVHHVFGYTTRPWKDAICESSLQYIAKHNLHLSDVLVVQRYCWSNKLNNCVLDKSTSIP